MLANYQFFRVPFLVHPYTYQVIAGQPGEDHSDVWRRVNALKDETSGYRTFGQGQINFVNTDGEWKSSINVPNPGFIDGNETVGYPQEVWDSLYRLKDQFLHSL